jgi:hypothetical protein
MEDKIQPALTWRKAALRITVSLLGSIVIFVFIFNQRIILSPPIHQYTLFFYLIAVLIPPLVVFVACARRHPTGSRLWFIILPLLTFLFICFYLVLIGPGLYSQIDCRTITRSGLMVHQSCTCKMDPSSTRSWNCDLDSLNFLPFAHVTDYK